MIKTPVLFLIFNRPESTRLVFDEIRKAQPKKLFISADGPRKEKDGEDALCSRVRDIIKQVDWDCEVYTLFRDENLGLKGAITSGINWFFEQVDEGIILEDDCLPGKSFFPFCQEMLEKYREDTRIMAVNSNNFQNGHKRGDASYFFSRIIKVWGWATWKRAWRHMDITLKTFPDFKENRVIDDLFHDEISRTFWMNKIEAVYNGGNSWAFAWIYAILSQGGLCVNPQVNLVSNIGFGTDAVHAHNKNSIFARARIHELTTIRHPQFIVHNGEADRYFSQSVAGEQMSSPSLFQKIHARLTTKFM